MPHSSTGNIVSISQDDIIKWKHFPRYWWIPPTMAIDAGLWCFLSSAPWINGSVNKREAGDLNRHRARYDVIICGRNPSYIPQFCYIIYEEKSTILYLYAIIHIFSSIFSVHTLKLQIYFHKYQPGKFSYMKIQGPFYDKINCDWCTDK